MEGRTVTLAVRVVQAQTSVSEEQLRRLARDSSPQVRRQVAANPRAPVDAVVLLVADRDWRTRAAIAARRDLPDDSGAALADDRVWQVRLALASSQHTGPRVWQSIAAAKNTDVRTVFVRNRWLPLDVSEQMIADGSKDVRSTLATCTPHRLVVERLLVDEHHDVRACALDNDLITEADIVAASHDRHLVVRGQAASSQLLPQADWDRLLNDRSSYVRDEARSARRSRGSPQEHLSPVDDDPPRDLTDPQALASWPSTVSKPRTKWLKLFPQFRPSQDEIPDLVAWYWRYSERIDRDAHWIAWWADSPVRKIAIYIQPATEERYDAEFENDTLRILAESPDADAMGWLAKGRDAGAADTAEATLELLIDLLMPTLAGALTHAGRSLGLGVPPLLPPKY